MVWAKQCGISFPLFIRLTVSGSKKVNLVSFIFSSHFYFIFDLFLSFLLLALRVRVKPINARREVWKNNIVPVIGYSEHEQFFILFYFIF